MGGSKRTQYVCNECGEPASSWAGKCASCGAWNSLEEQITADVLIGGNKSSAGRILQPESVTSLAASDDKRMMTQIKDVDNVLGGGIVVGSVVLIAGQPGIGKSTLLMQISSSVAKNNRVLYVSGEESGHQIGQRAKRLGVSGRQLQLVSSTSADDIAASIVSKQYDLVIVDSIQTVATDAISSAPGSVPQITNSTRLILQAAKQSNVAVIIVGHVTKDGVIAGPKVLEHVVDVVLQLEGDRYGGFKLLRATKNRFGPTHEAGIFEMVEEGLKPVDNPSAALLEERQASDGSVVLATLEGTRPILVEVQALVNKSNYGYPKRAASGIDLNRMNLLVAMLEKRTKLNLAENDIYINIVGGLKLTEPAADLAVCMAIGSAARGMQLQSNAVVFGEVGLSGEVRHVPFIEKRIHEAKKMGFEAAIGPKPKGSEKLPLPLHSVNDVRSALNQFLKKD
jgi:DNA repair protein RadA/Sms